jgi:hypothetical protein
MLILLIKLLTIITIEVVLFHEFLIIISNQKK